MVESLEHAPETAREEAPPPARRGVPWVQLGMALASAALGFVLVAQVRATETFDERLAAEREEDLAVILADLTAQSDALQSEISDLRLLLFEYESSAEAEDLARRSLEQRLEDLRVLSGVAPVEGEGLVLDIDDPLGQVSHERLVDVVHELRDSGAEAIDVGGVRLVASSAFTEANERLVVDGEPLEPPYRVAAVGPAEAMASALALPGGALDALSALPEVEPRVEELAQLSVPARQGRSAFIYAEPVPDDGESG